MYDLLSEDGLLLVHVRLVGCSNQTTQMFRGGFRIIFSLQKAFAEAVARSSYLNPVYQEMAGGHITDFYRRAHI